MAAREDEILNLQSLPKPTIGTICQQFESLNDILSLSSVSSSLKDACSESSAWRTLCEKRWGPSALHTHLFTPPCQRCDYKSLFLEVNGWRRTSQEAHWTSGVPSRRRSPPSNAAAISCSPALSSGNLQACTISHDCIISTAELASSSSKDSNPTIVYSYRSQQMPFYLTSSTPCSIQCLDYAKGIVAVGDVRGSLHIVHLPQQSTLSFSTQQEEESVEEKNSANSEDEEIEVDAFVAPNTQQYPITCFEYHRPSTRLFCLWDRGECGAWRPNDNGSVRIFDVENQQLVSSLKEILEHYELCTILCPNSSFSSSNSMNNDEIFDDQSSGGNLLITGTVKLSQDRWENGACPRCNPRLPASLCWHQHRSSNAALAFFDLRAGESPGRMIYRHPLNHRSLYPRLQLVRDNYVMVSHAGAPLVIWDRRFLDGGPVASPQLVLDNYAHHGREQGGRDAQMNIPERVSNALYLSCSDGNMLAGRADNGEIGVWDLSNTLGWWNTNKTDGYHSVGGGSGGSTNLTNDDDLSSTTDGVSEGIAKLKLQHYPIRNSSFTPSGESSSNWKRPVCSTYVQLEKEGAVEINNINNNNNNAVVVRPRAEVWIGPDWLAASGQGQLHYFHL